MKRKLLILMVTLLAVSSMTACGKKDDTKAEVTQLVNEQNNDDSSKNDEVKEETKDPKAIYEGFVNGKEPVYCDKYLDYFARHYNDEPEYSGFKENTPYLLADFAEALAKHYNYDGYGELSFDEVQYAYIDCGMDGIPELALRIPDIVEYGSNVVSFLIIKEIDGKLQLCYEKNAGYRCAIELNSNGLVNYDGSNGAGAHYYRNSFIDGNGDEQLIYELDEIFGVYGAYFPDMPSAVDIADEKGIADSILILGYGFDDVLIDDYETIVRNKKYTYYRVDDNYNKVEDSSIYDAGSDYYDFVSQTGLEFVSPDEMDKIISEHEKSIGYSEDLEKGDFPRWTTFYHANIDMRGEYVEEADTCVYATVSNPGWEYYSTVEYDPTNLPVVLTQKSKKANDIIDDDDWLSEIGESSFDPSYCSDEFYEYILSGDTAYEPYIINIYDKGNGNHIAQLDMSEFTVPPQIAKGDEMFVNEAVRCVKYSDGLFYVAMNHSTYASSAPQNGYIMALDPDNNYQVVWKSQPLVSNAFNFQIIDNTIICGYGFTAEKDYIYLLDKHSGVQTDIYPVKTGPDYFFIKDGTLYVRTYDTNYEFQISFG